MYLELGESETAAGTNLAVVADGRAPDDWPQAVDGTGSKGGSLGLTGYTARGLLSSLQRDRKSAISKIIWAQPPKDRAHLVKVAPDPALPILAEV